MSPHSSREAAVSHTVELGTRHVQTAQFGEIAVADRACPLCGLPNGDARASAYSHNLWTIKCCAACGFVYIDKAPVYEMQSIQMAWERTTKVEEERRAELRPVSYALSKKTRFRMRLLPRRTVNAQIAAYAESGNLLDLGCGNGGSFRGIPAGFRLFGIEISAELAGEADGLFRAHGGYALHAPSLDGLRGFADGFFAAVTLRSYLEHELHPLPVLREVSRVLAPTGVAIVKVPNYGSLNRRVMGRKWCGFRYPDHLNYFTPRTLRRMAALSGLRTRFGATGRLPTSDNMWAVLSKTDASRRA